jgi:ribonuclease H2 subunit C
MEKSDEDDEVMVDVRVAERVGEFEEVVVWGHGGEVDKETDVFARSVEEWLGFAEAIHGDEKDEAKHEKHISSSA